VVRRRGKECLSPAGQRRWQCWRCDTGILLWVPWLGALYVHKTPSCLFREPDVN